MYTSQRNSNGSVIVIAALIDNPNLTFRVHINFHGIKSNEYSSIYLNQAFLDEVNKQYPGVNAINLYLTKERCSKLFGEETTNSLPKLNKQYVCISQNDLTLTEEILKEPKPFFFKITNLYGLRNFTKISEVMHFHSS